MDPPTWTACKPIRDYMSSAWQRLPIAELFQPLPASVTLKYVRQAQVADRRSFPTGYDAIEFALSHWPHLPVLVQAAAGFGKSAVLCWAAYRFAARALEGDPSAPLPVYIDLAERGRVVGCANLTEVIERQLNDSGPFDYRVFREALASAVVLLDNLDLVQEPLSLRSLIRNAYGPRRPQPRVVMAYRLDALSEAAVDSLPESVRVTLGPLDARALAEWMERACPGLLYEVGDPSRRHLANLLTVPLFFAIAASMCLRRQPSRRSEYPGRTGLLDSFIGCAVHFACVAGRLPPATNFYEHSSILEEVCLAAAQHGFRDRILFHDLEDLIRTSHPHHDAVAVRARMDRWNTACRVATSSGLLAVKPVFGEYVFLHQQFAEYCAGRELARRLLHANEKGVFDAVLFEYLRHVSMDEVVRHALAVLSVSTSASALVHKALDLVYAGGVGDVPAFVAAVQPPLAFEWVMKRLPTANGKDMREFLRSLGILGIPQADAELLRIACAETVPLESRRAAAGELCKRATLRREPLVRLLMSWASDAQHGGRFAAAALGRLHAKEAVPILKAIAGSENSDEEARLEALSALATLDAQAASEIDEQCHHGQRCIGPPTPVGWLVDPAFGPDDRAPLEEVLRTCCDRGGRRGRRRRAIRLLGRRKGQEALAALGNVARDREDDPYVRQEALGVLWECDRSMAEGLARTVLSEYHEPPELRIYALELLDGDLDASDIEQICLMSADPEELLRSAAVRALCTADPERGAALAAQLMRDDTAPPSLRNSAAEQLVQMGTVVDFAALDSIVRHASNDRLRKRAMELLVRCKNARVPAILTEVAEDPNEHIDTRCEAACKLALVEPQSAERVLLGLYRAGIARRDCWTIGITESLVRASISSAIPLFDAVARDRSNDEANRYAAIDALLSFRVVPALPLAVQLCAESPMRLTNIEQQIAALGAQDEERWSTICTEAQRCGLGRDVLTRLARLAGRRVLPDSVEEELARQRRVIFSEGGASLRPKHDAEFARLDVPDVATTVDEARAMLRGEWGTTADLARITRRSKQEIRAAIHRARKSGALVQEEPIEKPPPGMPRKRYRFVNIWPYVAPRPTGQPGEARVAGRPPAE